MKKVITILAGIILSAAAFSQVSLGVQGIGNLSNAAVNTEDILNPAKKANVLPGAGLVASIGVGERLAVLTGVNYLQHGFRLTSSLNQEVGEDIANIKFDVKTRLNYLQVPVNVVYKFPSQFYEVYVGGGAYFSYGIGGKINITTTTELTDGEKTVEKEEQKAFPKESDGGAGLKRADAGVNIVAGVKIVNGLFANVSYQLGLTNNSGGDGGKYKNRGLQLSVGYFFWNKK